MLENNLEVCEKKIILVLTKPPISPSKVKWSTPKYTKEGSLHREQPYE